MLGCPAKAKESDITLALLTVSRPAVSTPKPLTPKECEVILYLARNGPKAGVDLFRHDRVVSSGGWDKVKKELKSRGLIRRIGREELRERGASSKTLFWLTDDGVDAACELGVDIAFMLRHIKGSRNYKEGLRNYWDTARAVKQAVGDEGYREFQEFIRVAVNNAPTMKKVMAVYRKQKEQDTSTGNIELYDYYMLVLESIIRSLNEAIA